MSTSKQGQGLARLLLCLSLFSFARPVWAEKETTDRQHSWAVEALFADQKAWDKAAEAVNAALPKITACKGKLGQSAKRLASCLQTNYAINKEYARLAGYAQRLNDADANDAIGQELSGRSMKLGSKLSEASSFIAPEILSIAPKKLENFLKQKELTDYRFTVENIVRLRSHSLNTREAEIAAQSGEMAATAQKTFGTFSTLNHPFAQVTLKKIGEVELTQAGYTKYRSIPSAEDREKVFQEFFGSYKKTRETYASLLEGSITKDRFYAKLQKYDSDIAAALSTSNVPLTVYGTMLDQVKAHKQLLWRYLKLKQKALGLKQLRYSDLYLPLTRSEAPHYSFEQAVALARDSIKPLGEDYSKILERGLSQRWMDVYPKKGKRSGAYMDGSAYDVHPFVLMNYNNDYESVTTFLHEFGHAGHSYLANATQPYHYADYPIFVAEVASTLNENLLYRKLLKDATAQDTKLFLLGQQLEAWRQTVFRQALFADFEQRIHALAAEGQTLTADLLEQNYLKLLREYYGHDEGIVAIDPLYGIEWAYVGHFYNAFYMFQYTTSFIASTALGQKIYSGDNNARDRYLAMLKAGGSQYPIDLLKLGGVDMSTAAPYAVAFQAMQTALDEAEKIVDSDRS